jgi:hypothetical protein
MKVIYVYEKFIRYFLENTTIDRFEDLIFVVNIVLKRHTNINTEVGLEECERYSPGLEWDGLEVNVEKTTYMIMS